MNLTNRRWREAAFANEVFVEMVERAGIEFGDWQATNERANVSIVGGAVLGNRGGRAWMALDVLIDQLAEGHVCLTSALRFDVTWFGGHQLRQLAGRQPLATHHNSADVQLLAGDRVIAQEHTKFPSAGRSFAHRALHETVRWDVDEMEIRGTSVAQSNIPSDLVFRGALPGVRTQNLWIKSRFRAVSDRR